MSEKNKTIKEQMQELDQVIDWFHGDEFNIEQATDMYKKAAKMAKDIETQLNEVKNEINIIKQQFNP